ncbi:unnamed protein product [Acanthoscelides obtectus]|uniref:Uncharacterized protein n=1 Tax=Acanthoscelides obtectus TaxID=200917 RepID=A0A9P0QEJ1_ACAOB|nr:unnamed protein product [Acanthoscelides obtectus]CAK1670257.1 hypothetical protein AOBTE_LOCUS27514 [Acanthoscelides obtectus]
MAKTSSPGSTLPGTIRSATKGTEYQRPRENRDIHLTLKSSVPLSTRG